MQQPSFKLASVSITGVGQKRVDIRAEASAKRVRKFAPVPSYFDMSALAVSIDLITRAGLPATMEPDRTSWVTMLPAPRRRSRRLSV
jgi:hypothetical protein